MLKWSKYISPTFFSGKRYLFSLFFSILKTLDHMKIKIIKNNTNKYASELEITPIMLLQKFSELWSISEGTWKTKAQIKSTKHNMST